MIMDNDDGNDNDNEDDNNMTMNIISYIVRNATMIWRRYQN